MLMCFLLVVIVSGERENTAGMYFRDINRCNYFSDRIEHGLYDRRHRGSQTEVSAYCTPAMVSEGTKFWD